MNAKCFSATFLLVVFLCGLTSACYSVSGEINNFTEDTTVNLDDIISADYLYEESVIVDNGLAKTQFVSPNEHAYVSEDGNFRAFVSSIDRNRYNNVEVTVVDNSSGAELIIPLSIHTPQTPAENYTYTGTLISNAS